MDCFNAYPSILIVILWIKTNRIHIIKCMIASRFILYSGPINICNKFNVSMPQKKVTLHLNMITISGASNRWKDNCSKLLYFTYNYQVPSRVKVKGIVHIVRTWAASTQQATGNRTQKAVCFFALFSFSIDRCINTCCARVAIETLAEWNGLYAMYFQKPSELPRSWWS